MLTDVAKLALISAFVYVALGVYLRRKQPVWSALVEQRRFRVLLLVIVTVTAIKVIEDVVNGESGPIDELVLRFIHANTPKALNGFFEAATLTGSAYILVPLSTAITVMLLFARRPIEALLLSAYVAVAESSFTS